MLIEVHFKHLIWSSDVFYRTLQIIIYRYQWWLLINSSCWPAIFGSSYIISRISFSIRFKTTNNKFSCSFFSLLVLMLEILRNQRVETEGFSTTKIQTVFINTCLILKYNCKVHLRNNYCSFHISLSKAFWRWLFYYLLFRTETFMMCQRFFIQPEKKYQLDPTKDKDFPIDHHYKNRPPL